MAASTMKYQHQALPERRAMSKHSIVSDGAPATADPNRGFYEMKPLCFRTDKRFHCSERCRWEGSCKKLVAAWLR